MQRLPPEILNKIFSQLSLAQQVICIHVCRNWWQVLNGSNIFYNVQLDEFDDQFNRIMEMFKQLPDRAAQVEQLRIILQSNTCLDKRSVLNIFPNARVIQVETKWASIYSTFSHFTTPLDNMKHSESKIESLSDIGHCELALQMQNLGARLKSLHLNFYYVASTGNVISQLKDLPVLKELSLRLSQINIYDLEAMHTNIPSIQHLALDGIAVTDSTMPTDIVPATLVTKFKYDSGSFESTETYAQFYQYLAKKYINITDVEYDDDELLNYDLSERRYIYKNGVVDFFKLIGPSLNKLAIYGLPDDVDVFKALDTVGSQIENFDFRACESVDLFQNLSRSNQSNHVQHVYIEETGIGSLYHIKSMMCLTSLSLCLISRKFLPVNLVNCLTACPPSLKHLEITCKHLVVEPFKTKLNSIESLQIGFKTLTSELGDIISFCFPNLINLVLTAEVSESVIISLQNPWFREATFITDNVINCRAYGFSFKSSSQTQYYHCHEKKKTRVEYQDIQELPILSVVSLTAKKLVTGDHIKVIPF